MTIEETIKILTDEIDLIKGMIYPSDMETTLWVANRVDAITNAIEALEEKYEREQSPCYRCIDKDHCEYCIYGSRLGE